MSGNLTAPTCTLINIHSRPVSLSTARSQGQQPGRCRSPVDVAPGQGGLELGDALVRRRRAIFHQRRLRPYASNAGSTETSLRRFDQRRGGDQAVERVFVVQRQSRQRLDAPWFEREQVNVFRRQIGGKHRAERFGKGSLPSRFLRALSSKRMGDSQRSFAGSSMAVFAVALNMGSLARNHNRACVSGRSFIPCTPQLVEGLVKIRRDNQPACITPDFGNAGNHGAS